MSALKNAMNTRKSNAETPVRGGSAPPSFVRYRMSPEEVAQARGAAEAVGDIEEIFDQLIGEGYKVSCSHDNYGGGVQVFLTPVVKDSPNWGWTLTGRAPTLALATGIVAFKHYTLFAQTWPKDTEGGKGEAWG